MCAAEPTILNLHRSTLMKWFADRYEESGGPPINTDELLFQTKLATALLGVAWILDAPSIITTQLPDVRLVDDRFDNRLKQNFLAHAQHHLLIVFLNEWLIGDIGGALREVVAKRLAHVGRREP